MPTKVPPATTVARSPCSARSASASSSEAGTSHSGSVDNCERLLVERLRQLMGIWCAHPLEHPRELRLRPFPAAFATRVPADDDRRVDLQERERIGRLENVL